MPNLQEISLDSLTSKQCECLELVLLHRTSKQIAMELGISRFTVDQRLDSARSRLGVSTRQDAAIAYAKLKGISQPFAYMQMDTPPPPESDTFEMPDTPGSLPDPKPDRFVCEAIGMADDPENYLIEKASDDDPAQRFSGLEATADHPVTGIGDQMLHATGADQTALISRILLIFGFAGLIMIMIFLAAVASKQWTVIFNPH